MTQTYTGPAQLARMRDGKCPECGAPVDAHDGLGGASCTLTDTGVASRIDYQRQLDAARSGDIKALSPVTQLVFRTLADGRPGVFTSKLAEEIAQPEWTTQDAVNLLYAAELIERSSDGWRIAGVSPNRQLPADVTERQAAERAALAARHAAERAAFEQDDHPANARPEPTEEEAAAVWGPISVDDAGPEETR